MQSYDILPSSDIKSKGIREREARALLCGVSKKNKGTETIQGSILLPNAGDEVRELVGNVAGSVAAGSDGSGMWCMWMQKSSRDAEKFSYYREYQLSIETLDSVSCSLWSDFHVADWGGG